MSETQTHAVMVQRVIPAYKLDLLRTLSREFDVEVVHAREARNSTVSDVADPGFANSRTWRVYAPGSDSTVLMGGLGHILRLRPRLLILEGSAGILNNYLFVALRPIMRWRIVVWTFGFDPDEGEIGYGLRDRLRMWLLRRADAVVVYWKKGRDKILDRAPDLAEGVFIAPNVVGSSLVDHSRKEWLERSQDAARVSLGLGPWRERRPLVVFVGRLIAEKRVDVLVRAIASLRSDGLEVTCAVIGDGPLRAEAEHEAAHSGVGDAVRFEGHIEPADMGGWFRAADLVAVPGRLGLVVSHAAAFGAPVMSVRGREGFHGEGEEYLVDGTTGWWCEDYDEYAACLKERLDDEAGLREIRARCLDYYEHNLREDSTVDGFRDALTHALGSKEM